jgi:hypothetical protein
MAEIVEKAEMHPAKCCVTGDIDGPFIDTGSWCDSVDPRIYLHAPLVEQYARDLLGMVPKAEVEKLTKQVENLKEEVEKLRKVEAAVDAIAEFEATKS